MAAFHLCQNTSAGYLEHHEAQKHADGHFPPPSWRLFCHQHERIATAAQQIPRPYSRADDSARELNGDFGMTPLGRVEAKYILFLFSVLALK